MRDGTPYLSHELASEVAFMEARGRTPYPLGSITVRELQILSLLAEGKPYGQIAGSLNVSYKTIDEALPLTYHSCASVVAEASGDNAYVDKVIRSLVALSLYNRDVEISWFEVSDDEKNGMHGKFIETLKAGCEADKDALLAGVVDLAVAKALSGRRPR